MYYPTKTALATLILASGVLAPLVLADDKPDSKIGTTVIITGCLHAGTHSDQYVLVGVTEKTATGIAPVPYAIYRLDSTKGMKPLVGELVDVSGKIVKRDSKPGIIKIDVGPDTEHTTDVEVENGNGTHGVTTKDYAGSHNETPSVVELARPIYHMSVDTVSAAEFQHYGPACK